MPAGDQTSRRRHALRRAAAALGVPQNARLSRALLAAAAEEVERSPAFAERVRALLAQDLLAQDLLAREAARPPLAPAARKPRLVPLTSIEDAEFDPFAPPDPRYLYRLYGAEQLPAALGEYSYASLRAAASRLFGGVPGGHASLPRGKAGLIAAIVASVTRQDG